VVRVTPIEDFDVEIDPGVHTEGARNSSSRLKENAPIEATPSGARKSRRAAR
jgi:hypothetical protein